MLEDNNTFNNLRQHPSKSGRFRLRSPILEAYKVAQECTKGRIITHTDMGPDALDRCTVEFRGEIVSATCCHPSLAVGHQVCMVEKPRGVWWATVLQPSWFSRPLADYVAAGYKCQAALEWLLRGGARYSPSLILIDKRGVPVPEPPEPPPWPYPYPPFPWDPNDPTKPQNFEFFDINGDGFIDPTEWPYNPALFSVWDLNGDGLITPDEWNKRGYNPAFWPASGWIAWVDSTVGFPSAHATQSIGGTLYPSNNSAWGDGAPFLTDFYGSPYKTLATSITPSMVGGKYRMYITGYGGATLTKLALQNGESAGSWSGDPGTVVADTMAAHAAFIAGNGTHSLVVYRVGIGIIATSAYVQESASAPIPPGATGAFYISDLLRLSF